MCDSLKPEGFGADFWSAADRGDILHESAPLLSAGVDTTVYGISSMLHAFAAHPEQWQNLRGNARLSRIAFDEALRWESPVQQPFRETSAANRDPRRWESSEQFDLSRDPSGHLAFGMGVHQCVGQHAARLQAACLLEKLIPQVESVELTAPLDHRLELGWTPWALG